MNSERATQQKRGQMKFANKHVDDVLNREKTATVRLGKEWSHILLGMTLELCDEDGNEFATAEIRNTSPLRVSTAHDVLSKSNGYPDPGTREEFVQNLQGYYPDTEIDSGTRVIVVWFEVSAR